MPDFGKSLSIRNTFESLRRGKCVNHPLGSAESSPFPLAGGQKSLTQKYAADYMRSCESDLPNGKPDQDSDAV
jgi:hypothetical protein